MTCIKGKNSCMKDPFQRYTCDNIRRMSDEEFDFLMEEHNEYVRTKYSQLNENQNTPPDFNSIEELRQYYGCRHLDEALDRINQLFEDKG